MVDNILDNQYQNYDDNLFDKLLNESKNLVNFHVLTQYEFFNQWKSLKQYANKKNVKILGDIPIYVNHDSADVWALQREAMSRSNPTASDFIEFDCLRSLSL